MLGLALPHRVASRLDEADKRNTRLTMTGNRGNPNVTIVNESGLYDVILDSRKPRETMARDDSAGA